MPQSGLCPDPEDSRFSGSATGASAAVNAAMVIYKCRAKLLREIQSLPRGTQVV